MIHAARLSKYRATHFRTLAEFFHSTST